jgi:SET domain-containing protein
VVGKYYSEEISTKVFFMQEHTDRHSFILRPSTTVDGVGVFALHDIAKDTHMELFLPDFEEEIRNPEDVPEELRSYCLVQENGKLLCPKHFNRMDIGNYLNHSESPNLKYDKGKGYFSLRDIRAGEELFANYRELDEPVEMRSDYYRK